MSLGPEEESRLIEAVRRIAAEEILPRFRMLGADDIATKSRHDDLVTVADRAAEARIAEAAAGILPGAVVIGEEAVSEDPALVDAIAGAGRCLIVDPVDGTWNFAHGIATFGVILALAEAGRTVWGMIYDPVADDWAVAHRGGGARMVRAGGGERALTLSAAPVQEIGSMMGFAHSYLFRGEPRQRLFDRLPAFHRTDALRCSAHEYRQFAQGAADFCLSPVLNPWDHAAGCLIAEEAGGVARLLSGEDYGPTAREGRLLVARTDAVWNRVAAHLDGI